MTLSNDSLIKHDSIDVLRKAKTGKDLELNNLNLKLPLSEQSIGLLCVLFNGCCDNSVVVTKV